MTMISRNQWGASRAKRPSVPWKQGYPNTVTVHYTGDPVPMLAPGPVPYGALLRGIQYYHLHNAKDDYNDIAYNVAVDRLGNVYEARGMGVQSGAQVCGNATSLAVLLLVSPGEAVPDVAWNAVLTIAAGRPLKGHKDWSCCSTSCPGDQIMARIHGTAPRPAPGPAPAQPANDAGLLRRGSRGPAVTTWQRILVGASLLAERGVDGIFGPKTEAATRAFQKKLGVAPDGIVGPATQAATARLFKWLASPPAEWAAANRVAALTRSVRRGMTGDTVRVIQQRLADLGHRLAVDGIFGPATDSVVRHFQQIHGLVADGIVGPKTWAALWR